MAWLASLGIGGDASPPEDEPSKPDLSLGAESPPAEGDLALAGLVELGFESAIAEDALAAAGGHADEALRLLQESGAPSPKRRKGYAEVAGPALPPDVLEIEGFTCRLRGDELVLWLPHVGCDGPRVGRQNADGSLIFNGLDEWAQELYEATPCRGVPSKAVDVTPFEASSALAAFDAGAPWVWRSFASEAEILAAHSELEQLRADGTLHAKAAATTASEKARSDLVTFLDFRGGSPSCPPACRVLFQRLDAAGAAMGELPGGPRLLCPRGGQAAVYDGGGGFYAPHRDNDHAHSGGWLNHRLLTAIVYVNPEGFHSAEDGGHLRCHVGAADGDQTGATAQRTAEDVAPLGGTAVLFPARRLLHEVRPTSKRRYALTLWMLESPSSSVGSADEDGLGVSAACPA